ncbi:uncharacterized protein LOC129944967 [Eupeodes corollae]|uniref:uncharacterized protein LOC129944967 n=1 Tax=Eupeodes corollae TaxID=290404 RepID=UPI002491D667|nr:uncharacterized protein LOC129944967 [Eupeodes corollae]
MFRNSIRHHNDISFKKKLREIKPGPNAFKEINRLIGRRKPLPEVMMSNNIELTSTNDKVEAFAKHFEQSFTTKPSTDQAFLNEVETPIQLIQQPNIEVQFDDNCKADEPANTHKFCNPEEIAEIINNLKPKKNFFVEIDSCKSTIRDVKAEFAQGSKLGPFLYSLMTSDQPVQTDCENLLFADDSLTYSSSMFSTIAARRVESHISRLYTSTTRSGE